MIMMMDLLFIFYEQMLHHGYKLIFRISLLGALIIAIIPPQNILLVRVIRSHYNHSIRHNIAFTTLILEMRY